MKLFLVMSGIIFVTNFSWAQNLNKILKHSAIGPDYAYFIDLGSNSKVSVDKFNNWAAKNDNISEAFDIKTVFRNNESYVINFKIITFENRANNQKWRIKAKEADIREEKRQDAGAKLLLTLGATYINNVVEGNQKSKRYSSNNNNNIKKSRYQYESRTNNLQYKINELKNDNFSLIETTNKYSVYFKHKYCFSIFSCYDT